MRSPEFEPALIIPGKVKLTTGEAPNEAALRELSEMGLIQDGNPTISISVRSIPTKSMDGQSNVEKIWNGNSDSGDPKTWFYPYNPKWGQNKQARGRSYWFVRSDCLEETKPQFDWQSGYVRFITPCKDALILIIEESD